LVVFNKADLLEPDTLESILRTAQNNDEREAIAVSALKPETLPPMLERAGALLARDLTRAEFETRAEGSIDEDSLVAKS
jgi:50S ribosomal subunit-associated GTPase HflX